VKTEMHWVVYQKHFHIKDQKHSRKRNLKVKLQVGWVLFSCEASFVSTYNLSNGAVLKTQIDELYQADYHKIDILIRKHTFVI